MGEEATTRWGLPFPKGTGSVKLGAQDLKELAERLDAVLPRAGALQFTAKATIDEGWLPCEGQAVSRTTYKELFEAIGTSNGAGNGTTTFNLPDYRERSPMGPGLTFKLGAKTGSATVALTKGQLPSYSLPVTDPGHTHDTNVRFSQQVNFTNGVTGTYDVSPGGPGETSRSNTTGISVSSGGGNESHNNQSPVTVCNVWIKT